MLKSNLEILLLILVAFGLSCLGSFVLLQLFNLLMLFIDKFVDKLNAKKN